MQSRIAEHRIKLAVERKSFAIHHARVEPQFSSRFNLRAAAVNSNDAASHRRKLRC